MKNFKDMWEDAAANSVAGGGVSLPADAMGKNAQKKKKRIYDGRTREGKKFVERILARRTARAEAKAKAEQKEVTEAVEEMKGAEEWQEYAELLATKARLIKKNNKPSSAVIRAINKKINVLLNKLGVTEQEANLHLEALSKYDFRYYRPYELELKNRAYGYDVEQAFKKAGYDIYGKDLSVSGPTIKFNDYSKKWGRDEKKLKAAIKKVLGIDVDRL